MTITRPVVFLATETDSLRPNRQIWEVGMVRRSLDGTESKQRLFLPIDLSHSDLAVLNVGGFFDRHPSGRKVAGRPEFDGPKPIDSEEPTRKHDAAKIVARWTHGATVVGACPWRSTEALARLMAGQGYMAAWHHRLVCVESMFLGFDGGTEPLGLADIVDELDINAGKAHTALGDALTVMRVYDEIRRLNEVDE